MEQHERQTSGLSVSAAVILEICRLQFFHLRAVKSSTVNIWEDMGVFPTLHFSMLTCGFSVFNRHAPLPTNPFFSFFNLHLKELLILVITCLFLFFFLSKHSQWPSLSRLGVQHHSLSLSLFLSVSDVGAEPQLSQSSCRASTRSRPFAFHLQTGRKGGSSPVPWLNSAVSWPVFSPSHIIKGTTGGRAGGSEIGTGAMAPPRSALMSCWKVSRSSPPAFQALENNEPSVCYIYHLCV